MCLGGALHYSCASSYRQHCTQRKVPVFKLLRRRFEVFRPQGRQVAPMGVKIGVQEWTKTSQNVVGFSRNLGNGSL